MAVRRLIERDRLAFPCLGVFGVERARLSDRGKGIF
jgi:hypothetical protein